MIELLDISIHPVYVDEMPRFRVKHLLIITTVVAITLWLHKDHTLWSDVFLDIVLPVCTLLGLDYYLEKWWNS